MSKSLKNLESNIQQKIWRKRKEGSILFSEDFLSVGTQAAVNKALSELAKKGVIIRLAPGIYCKPQIDEVFGLGVMYQGNRPDSPSDCGKG